MGEINLYGIYIPILLVQAIIAYLLFKFSSPLTDRLIAKGWIVLLAFLICVFTWDYCYSYMDCLFGCGFSGFHKRSFLKIESVKNTYER